jgi:hypothetical protein
MTSKVGFGAGSIQKKSELNYDTGNLEGDDTLEEDVVMPILSTRWAEYRLSVWPYRRPGS